MTRPFRFAAYATGWFDRAGWRQLAEKVEDLGFSTLAVADHIGPLLDPVPAMAIAAEATTTLRVASMVLANDLRNPVLVARELGTLDLLLDGRIEVGLGTGWMPSDYSATGTPLESGQVRLARLTESVEIITGVWDKGECTFNGQHYEIVGATWQPFGAPRPRPPLLIGGGGPKVLELAARSADIVSANFIPGRAWGPKAAATALAERFDERIAWVRAAAGDRFDQLELHCMAVICEITDAGAEARRRIGEPLGLSAEQVAGMPIALTGTAQEIADTLLERRERYGISYVTVRADVADSFAAVIDLLHGR
jgi:probable F420-dependent oxidoreductase